MLSQELGEVKSNEQKLQAKLTAAERDIVMFTDRKPTPVAPAWMLDCPVLYQWQDRGELADDEALLSRMATRQAELMEQAEKIVNRPKTEENPGTNGGATKWQVDSAARMQWIVEWSILNHTQSALNEKAAGITTAAVESVTKSFDEGKRVDDQQDPVDATDESFVVVPTPEKPVYKRMVFAVGGRVGTVDPVPYVERYNLEDDSWSRMTALKTARSGVAVATLNGHIYVMNGESNIF